MILKHDHMRINNYLLYFRRSITIISFSFLSLIAFGQSGIYEVAYILYPNSTCGTNEYITSFREIYCYESQIAEPASRDGKIDIIM